MSISHQFGYASYSTPASPLSSSQLLPPTSSSTSSSPAMSSQCCENGKSLVNPHTGQTVCSCQYPAGLLTYSRVGLPDPMYSTTPYSAPQGYMSLGTDPSAFYPPLNAPYELKEAGETWRGIGQAPGCYPYDPTGMPPYPYPNAYGTMDINSAARRKNATRENTNTLKAWLYEHRKNPYPTKGEKIMLAIITKMTLTQVSTWFANARRRLKKENKMTWSPRNKPGDNDDDEEEDSKDKGETAESDDENSGRKSPTDEKKSCDREGQLADDVKGESSPSTSMRTTRMYDTPSETPHMSKPNLLGQSYLHDPSLLRRPSNFAPPQISSETPPTFLGLPPVSHGYNGAGMTSLNGNMTLSGRMTSDLELATASSLKRPDSLCSNSNDSGLSDVNCGYPDGIHAGFDGLRPKIWSLAHVATSEPGYMNHSNSVAINSNSSGGGINSSSGSSSNINNLPRNLSTHGRSLGPLAGAGPSSASLINSGLTAGHVGHEGGGAHSTSSPSSSMSSMTCPSSMPPQDSGMSQWGPMYGGPLSLGGGPFGKSACQAPMFPESLSGVTSGGPMATSPSTSLAGLHPSSPSPGYSHTMSSSNGYYPNTKMGLE